MAGNIIWFVTVFGCAVLFFGIGIYADKLEKPMWFWAGSDVDPSKITDVEQYNRENAKMWKRYSLWYWASGISWFWNEVVGIVLLILGCSIGIALLVFEYLQIEKRYIRK